ncbi:hypothetical protein DESUT3_00630 [Desulfuromonas versatilis]|uniref:Uncharacterized protein n=1 Tax=Desulfuromonas versatilis TaxID=2802975 RepID=A0ABM8HRD6_9BACT|nr:hypothetical protein DESUT3_00630 [Desulfuromonas versatilis]
MVLENSNAKHGIERRQAMTKQTITGDMRVWNVIERFPET